MPLKCPECQGIEWTYSIPKAIATGKVQPYLCAKCGAEMVEVEDE